MGTDTDVFFVLSTGRCGSTSIRDFLNQSPGAHCLHEAEPQLIAEATRYAYGEFPHADMVALLRSTRPPVVDGKQYGESHHKLSFVFPALEEAFPGARYVWLLRDGRATVSSMHARGWYTGSPELHEWERWRIRGDRLGVFTAPQWAQLNAFEKCCWHWAFVNRLIQRYLNVVAERTLRMRLERLEESAPTLFGFLGLPAPPAYSLGTANVSAPHHNRVRHAKWEAWQHAAFQRFCGSAMDDWYPGWQGMGAVVDSRDTPSCHDRR